MEEVVERLLDPIQHNGRPRGGRCPNPYRPSVVQNRRADVHFTATWCGELRVQNEALADENACAKEQTLRDLERLTAAGTMSTGIRSSYNQQQSSYVVSCSGDMRAYALDEDDLRIPSFLRNRTNIPMRRMQVPGMRQDTGSDTASTNDDSFLEMGLGPIADYSNVVARSPSSVSSSEVSSAVEKGKLSLRRSKMAKCVKGLKSWRKLQRPGACMRETPSIREDRDYDFANETFTFPASSLLARGTCFMCLGGMQATKYSTDEAEPEAPEENTSSVKSADVKSILLTTSPLYGDVNPTPRSNVDDRAFSTQQSLNIAATHNPTTDVWSESDEESDVPDERDIAEIWDDDESDRDSAINTDESGPMKHWDCSFTNSWEPPTLKTDQEYEMYQLQSRMEAENVVRKRLTPSQTSPPPHRFTPDELVDTASLSSWDVKLAQDFSGGKRPVSRGSSTSWSDLGLEAVPSGRSEFNNQLSR